MKKKLIYIVAGITFLLSAGCSKKELDIKNPNSPTPDNAQTESGIQSLALGAVYTNGFIGITDTKYTNSFLGSSYWFLASGYHDLMADVVTSEAANNVTNQISLPDYVILDDGTKITNSAPVKTVLKVNNSRTQAGLNTYYYEWTWMYFLNNACNGVLSLVDKTSFTGDSTTKKNTLKAWAYFWKGFAYSHIGSQYFAGLIKDDYTALSNEYKSSADMITASNANFDKAIAALNAVPTIGDYNTILKGIIPTQTVTGKGGYLTPTMWIHNINTMKARNLLVNKRVKDMTSADWTSLLALVNNGITSTDLVFTARSAATGNFLSATGGSSAALTTGTPTGTTYKISERLIQEYKTGDKRLANDFVQVSTYFNTKGGFTFSTRWRLLDSGGITKTYTPASVTSKVVGQFELFIEGSYEENELMKAEANIELGNIAAGLASVDAVRTYQGAGLAAVSGVITDPALAYEEVRKERRIALLFRDVALYDARRWGVLDDISAGGGRTNAVVVNSSTGAVNVKATINYNFPDYWDVPDDETSLNPPSATSAPVKNPKN
jgi:hypothetical protein